MVKKALLIAYHYPPIRVSSGVQRTLSFSQNLGRHGWTPLVLSAHPRAYASTSPDQLRDIPDDVLVKRAFALDTGKHLAVAGRYLDAMALPDRWVTWFAGGVLSGLRLIRRHKPSVIFSTYPIATAHLIGLALHRLTGVPWVADFRDSMTEVDYPPDPRRRKMFRAIERRTIRYCSRAIFTTPGAVRMYRERYPEQAAEKWSLIANGYNEDIFAAVETEKPASGPERTGPLTLVHSGVLYPNERDPRAFFEALSGLKREGALSARRVRIILRATGHDDLYQTMLRDLDIADMVELAPGIDYREALREMLAADGLLILQAANCNHQIPAKLYEYFRARRPVFALTDSGGDTATVMREAGIEAITPLDDAAAIRASFPGFVDAVEQGTAAVASEEAVETSSRAHAAAELAALFDQAAADRGD
jgi:hypothetical protein